MTCRTLRSAVLRRVAVLLLLGVATAARPAPVRFQKVPVQKVSPADARVDANRLDRRADVLARRWRAVHDLVGPRHVSRRGLRDLARAGAIPLGGKTAEPAQLNVLLVRISFASDRAGDLTSVTTDGGFQLAPDTTAVIDPPPHDRAYFESHLFGLAEYYRIQSGGLLDIRGRVLPEGDEDSYVLSDIADYAPEGGWTLAALDSLVRDMIRVADTGSQADGSAVLADYDDDDPLTYIVFVHSGSDWQSDINQDSPYDIPTFFVRLGRPVALTSHDTDTGAPGLLSECSIIPETTTQDGFLGSIAGAMYHEFGHALGLVDVYDTSTGLPSVGLWDLMDSGPNLIANVGFLVPGHPDSVAVYSVAGLLPPSLGIWNKWFLGWVDAAPLTGDARTVHLPAVEVPRSQYARWYSGQSVGGLVYDFDPDYPQAIAAGASPREFFLLENRWVPLSGDELPDQTGIGFVRDPDTGVFLYMGGDEVDPDGPFGPLPPRPRNTGMYDFFLPAGGLLVWHVNEERIEERLDDNSINALGDGLRLLEADGIQDVGVYAPYVIGFFGSERDPFRAPDYTELPVSGAPSSRAYDRSWTGVELSDISEPLPTMTFRGRLAGFAAGTPWYLPPAAEDAPRRADPATATPLVLAAGDSLVPGLLLASPAVTDTTGQELEPPALWLLTGGEAVPLWQPGVDLAGPPVVGPAPSGDGVTVCAVAADGTFARWEVPEGAAQPVPATAPLAVADDALSGPVLVGDTPATSRAVFATDGTRLAWVPLPDPAAAVVGEPLLQDGPLGPPVVVPAPEEDLVLVAGPDGWVLVDGPSAAPLAAGTFPARATGPVVPAVVTTADGFRFLFPVDEDLVVVDWRPDGGVTGTTAWPAPLGEEPLAGPGVADLDGDGRDDVILVGPTRATVLGQAGAPLTGFPLVLADQFPLDPATRWSGGCAVLDADGDGGNDLLLTTDGGHLLVFDAQGRLHPGTPVLWADHGANGLVVAPEPAPVAWLVAPGGRRTPGLGERRVDGFVAGWRVAGLTGTSAWLGPAGGARRRGTTGRATAVAGPAVAAVGGTTFLAYPNPLHGADAVFRFACGTDGRAVVTVYDLEGEVVARLAGTGRAGLVNEIRWRAPDLAPGVYMCRLELPAGEPVRTRWCRLAVEH